MADKSTELDTLLSKGIDLKNRCIYFGAVDDDENGFTWQTVELAIRGIHKLLSDFPTKPIELHMSSPGGSVYDMLRLVDVIHQSSAKIIFIGSGEICSSAAFLMSVCDERILHPNSIIMLHDISEAGDESAITTTDRKINDAESDRLQDTLYRLLEANGRMSYDFWKEVLCRDLYLTPTEAIMLGLADKIIEPKKRGNLRKSRRYALEHGPDKKELGKLIKSLFKRVYKGRTINKIEIHTPQDQFDDSIVVDDTPVPMEFLNPTPTESTEDQ
jgi:ATP-dependent Clp protease protease subunit